MKKKWSKPEIIMININAKPCNPAKPQSERCDATNPQYLAPCKAGIPLS
jgi:hypothetical protein